MLGVPEKCRGDQLAWEALGKGNVRLDGGGGEVGVRAPKTWWAMCKMYYFLPKGRGSH